MLAYGGHTSRPANMADWERQDNWANDAYENIRANPDSSAIAAHLALGYTPLEAAQAARALAAEAVRDGLRGIGAGPGPVDVLGLTTSDTPASHEARTARV